MARVTGGRRTKVTGAAIIALLVAGGVVAARGPSSQDRRPSYAQMNANGGPATAMTAVSSSPTTTMMAQAMRGAVAGGAGGSSVPADVAGSTGEASSMAIGAPAPAPAAPPGIGGPKIVKTATLSLEVGRNAFSRAFREATAVASAQGGYVASSTSESHKGRLSVGTIQMRVPADRFDAARQALLGLGKVSDEQIGGQDVSGQLVDIEARLRSLGAQEDALRVLMAKARTIGETIEVQQQLTQVRQQIEELSGQKARLDDSTAFATISVTLSEPGVAVAPPKEPSANPLSRAVHRAAHGVVLELAGVVVVLGYALPLALLALLGWAGWRLADRRRVAAAG
jgi:hypothetical protein